MSVLTTAAKVSYSLVVFMTEILLAVAQVANQVVARPAATKPAGKKKQYARR